jgi:hypothetical protein
MPTLIILTAAITAAIIVVNIAAAQTDTLADW